MLAKKSKVQWRVFRTDESTVAHISKDRWRMACEDVKNQRVICVTRGVLSGVPQLVFPPLIFSFFGARPRWPPAKRSLQEHAEPPRAGCVLTSHRGRPLSVGLSAPKIRQPCRVTAQDLARSRTEASAGDLCGARGREAPPSWPDDGGGPDQ